MAALVGIAPNLGTILAAHVAFQFVDGGRFRPAYDIQRHGLVSVTAQAADLKVEIPCVERVSQRRRRLGRPLVPEHALIPSHTGKPVGLLARFLRAFRGMPDRAAVDCLARLGAHWARMDPDSQYRQAATDCGLTPNRL